VSSGNLSNAEMIAALHLAFLGREPEPSALAYLEKALAEGALDARSLIATFRNCDEYRQRQPLAPLLYPAGHFYSPIVNVDELRGDAARVFDRTRPPVGIDLNAVGQLALLPILRSFARDLPFQETKRDGRGKSRCPRLINI
jgi:hypothetical protein